jgi:adenylate cyclase
VAGNLFAARFRWLEALPLLIVIGLLAAIALGALASDQAGGNPGRERLFDTYQRLVPAPAGGQAPFHVVSIDRESIRKIGPWPWPRTLLAEVAERARASGAQGVVIVEPVDSPDPLSPATIGEFWLSGARDADLARQLALLPNTDEALAKALNGWKSAVAIGEPAAPYARAVKFQRADIRSVDWLKASAAADFLALPSAAERAPMNAQLRRASPPAVAALPVDRDGVLRRLPPLWSVDGRATPSLALAAAAMANPGAMSLTLSPSEVDTAGVLPKALTIGERTMPLGSDLSLRFHLAKRIGAPETPAWRLLEPASSNAQLGGTIVLIGLDAVEGRGIETPRGVFSAAQVHALAAAQMANGVGLARPGWAPYAEAIAVMLLGAAAIMWSQRLAFWKAIGVAALASVALLLASFSAFAFGDLLLDPGPAALSLFLGAFSVAGGRSLGVVLRDEGVRGSFQGSLPEPTMRKLREEGAAEILDGGFRPLSVLACELRFTDDDMERLSGAPDDATKMIASACLDLRKAIIDVGGAAEQAEGGKMFAYFNAPLENADHMNAACAAALRLIESMDKVNAGIETSPRTRGVQLHLAIGVASGDCFVGPMGHGRANRYSAIGPAVDLAIFLRRQAEYYGPAIICDETVFRRTNHHFAFLELDRIKTNKSDKPANIYALVGNPFIKSSKSFRALDDAHRQLLTAYRSGDWAAARQMLNEARKSPGSKVALFDIYEERIRKLSELGVPSDWDGAHAVVI